MNSHEIISTICFLCALPLLYAAGYARGRTDQIKEDLHRRHNVLDLSIRAVGLGGKQRTKENQ